MEMSAKDRLIILAMWVIAMIILILIFWDPIDILDPTQKIILAIIVMVANIPLLLYQVKRIKNKAK
jgi:hypothetical protein